MTKRALITGVTGQDGSYLVELLLDQGYEVYIVADGVSSRSAANKEVGIRAMMQAGARITCVEMALFEMMHVAEGDQFRQLIKIIK